MYVNVQKARSKLDKLKSNEKGYKVSKTTDPEHKTNHSTNGLPFLGL